MKHQKRVNSMGKTKYYVRVHVGKGKYETVGTFPSKREADAAYEDAKARRRGGMRTRLNESDFTDFTEGWLSTLTVRDSTLADYRNTCRHLCDHFGHRQLQAITPEDVRAFVKDYSRTHASYTTKKAVTRLRQIFRVAVADDYLAKSPAERVSNLPQLSKHRQVNVLERGQIRALSGAMPEYWWAFVDVAIRTGLRRGELFGLRWEDVRWKQDHIRVVNQLSAAGALVEPKSSAARRRVDMSHEGMRLLREHRSTCPESDLGLVFPTPSGKPVHTGNFQRSVWEPARKRAGLPEVRMHDLRHTFASLLIQGGQSVKYVQTVLGHADAQTTLNVYGHLFEGSGPEAASGLETALPGTRRRTVDA